MLSTTHDGSMIPKQRCSCLAPEGIENVMKFKMIEEYNKNMGDVDKSTTDRETLHGIKFSVAKRTANFIAMCAVVKRKGY